ncbi:MAG: efflux RND transporter periplasmic adaptor subunit [Bacteroidota bacterium]
MKNITLISTVILCMALIGCKKNYINEDVSAKAGSNIKKVKVQEITPVEKPIAIRASGLLASSSEMKLSFKVPGIVQAVNVNEGQYVKKGAVLATLNLSEINAQVLQAKRGYEKALRDLERVNNLFQDTVATLEQVQDAQTATDVAKAALEIANFNRQYSQIVAPMNGKILKRAIEPNELVNPGQPMFVFGGSGNNGAQVIKIGLADVDVVKLSAKDTASVSFDAFPNRSYSAFISEIAEAADPATGTFEVELTLSPNYYPELKNGFVGKIELFPSNDQPYYQVPMAALVEGVDKKALVYLTEDKKTVQQKVLPVSSIHTDFFTVPAINEKESLWVVTEGGAYLVQNDTIQILN